MQWRRARYNSGQVRLLDQLAGPKLSLATSSAGCLTGQVRCTSAIQLLQGHLRQLKPRPNGRKADPDSLPISVLQRLRVGGHHNHLRPAARQSSHP